MTGIRFKNYARLPLWQKGLILASNHPGRLEVVIIPLLYFPWWFRSLIDKIIKLVKYTFWFLQKKQSDLDIKSIGDFNDVPVSTADKNNVRWFWWILEGWNIFINRQRDSARARAAALLKAITVLENGGRIVIFPGGGRDYKTPPGEGIYDIKTRQFIMRMPQVGLGVLVERTGALLVPIRIEGTDRIIPNEINRKLPKIFRLERFFPRFWRRVVVKIGQPIKLPKGTPRDVVLQEYIKAQISLYYEGRRTI